MVLGSIRKHAEQYIRASQYPALVPALNSRPDFLSVKNCKVKVKQTLSSLTFACLGFLFLCFVFAFLFFVCLFLIVLFVGSLVGWFIVWL